MSTLAKRLSHIADLQLPGFKGTVRPGAISHRALDNEETAVWFARFVERVVDSIGHAHLPVYRMADGEFIFCVGPRPELGAVGSPFWVDALHVARYVQRRAVQRPHGVETCWGEFYTARDRRALMPHFVRCVVRIATQGCLALCFTQTQTRFAEQYFAPMCRWLERHHVPITRENYFPFFFVYALLCGPERFRLLRGRKVLIVTSAAEAKREAIRRTLGTLGARDVAFLPISRTRSPADVLNLSGVPWLPDVVLVAAGIGAASVLDQLAPFRTVCLDAGICVEALADPSKRERIFMVPDDEGDIASHARTQALAGVQ